MYTLRKGTRADVPAAHRLIMELAVFEKAPDAVINTPEQMLEDGFGPNPVFWFHVAEHPTDGVVGMALCYTRYSTWKGPCIYLEDLIVTETHRRKGLGKLLLDQVVADAHERKSPLVIWQVLDWNTPAIDFYKSVGAVPDPQWINCKLEGQALQGWQFGPMAK